MTKVDGIDIHVMINDKEKFIFNSACLTPTESPLPPMLDENIGEDGKVTFSRGRSRVLTWGGGGGAQVYHKKEVPL